MTHHCLWNVREASEGEKRERLSNTFCTPSGSVCHSAKLRTKCPEPLRNADLIDLPQIPSRSTVLSRRPRRSCLMVISPASRLSGVRRWVLPPPPDEKPDSGRQSSLPSHTDWVPGKGVKGYRPIDYSRDRATWEKSSIINHQSSIAGWLNVKENG